MMLFLQYNENGQQKILSRAKKIDSVYARLFPPFSNDGRLCGLNYDYLSYLFSRMVNLATFMGHYSSVGITTNSGQSAECVRRVILEARNYIRNPHPAVDIFPGQTK